MKKEKKKKEFVPPTRFELVLTHKDKKVLTKVIKWLLIGNASSSSFQWEINWLERSVKEQNTDYVYNLRGQIISRG